MFPNHISVYRLVQLATRRIEHAGEENDGGKKEKRPALKKSALFGTIREQSLTSSNYRRTILLYTSLYSV